MFANELWIVFVKVHDWSLQLKLPSWQLFFEIFFKTVCWYTKIKVMLILIKAQSRLMFLEHK